jgi:hypothetical protein
MKPQRQAASGKLRLGRVSTLATIHSLTVKPGNYTFSYSGKELSCNSRATRGDKRKTVARLTVISAASARAGRGVILKASLGWPISGNGHLTFACGNCGAVVLQNVTLEQVRDCVIECDCGAFNGSPSLSDRGER